MNKNNDKQATPYGDSSTPSSQPGDANAKANPGSNAGNQGQGRNPAQSQNQPHAQPLQPQQQQLQTPKANSTQGAANQQTAGTQPNTDKHSGGNKPQGASEATGKPAAQCKTNAAGQADHAACEEAMKKMEEAGTPGPAHKALEPMIGNWKAEVKCWKDGAGEARVSQGTAKTHWILQGRFLKEDFTGEMMGKPFKGQTLLGFDNIKQTYNLVWLADTTTSIFTSEGRADSGNRVITLEGQATCPQRGQIAVKSVYRILGADKHVFEMYHEGRKSLEVTYTRA